MTDDFIDTKYLKTVKNFAIMYGVTPSYIYKLCKEKKIDFVIVDGVYFVDASKSYTVKGLSIISDIEAKRIIDKQRNTYEFNSVFFDK